MGLIQALARAVTAALRALASFSIRFCQQSGRWIVERVVTPAWDYFGEATTAATKAVVGLVPDTIRGAAKVPGAALRGTAAVLAGGGKVAGATLSAAAAVPAAIASGLAQGRVKPPAPPSSPQPDVSRELAAALTAMDARHAARVQDHPRAITTPGDAYASQDAKFVYEFACAGRNARDLMDLEELPPHLQDWLLSLDETQLTRLARSGLAICEKAILGQRTGIIGLPKPAEPDLEPTPSGETYVIGEVLGDRNAFAARVARAKGYREREPLY